MGPSRPLEAPQSCPRRVSATLPTMIRAEKMRARFGSPSARMKAVISSGMPLPAVPSKHVRVSSTVNVSPKGMTSHAAHGAASNHSRRASSTCSLAIPKPAAMAPIRRPPTRNSSPTVACDVRRRSRCCAAQRLGNSAACDSTLPHALRPPPSPLPSPATAVAFSAAAAALRPPPSPLPSPATAVSSSAAAAALRPPPSPPLSGVASSICVYVSRRSQPWRRILQA